MFSKVLQQKATSHMFLWPILPGRWYYQTIWNSCPSSYQFVTQQWTSTFNHKSLHCCVIDPRPPKGAFLNGCIYKPLHASMNGVFLHPQVCGHGQQIWCLCGKSLHYQNCYHSFSATQSNSALNTSQSSLKPAKERLATTKWNLPLKFITNAPGEHKARQSRECEENEGYNE